MFVPASRPIPGVSVTDEQRKAIVELMESWLNSEAWCISEGAGRLSAAEQIANLRLAAANYCQIFGIELTPDMKHSLQNYAE
jgi:hypothetical protein